MQSSLGIESRLRVFVYLMEQDDPKKCTSAKLLRMNLARQIRRRSVIPNRAIVLNPSARHVLLPSDREHIQNGGLVAIDCSWNKADEVFISRFHGLNRRLPLLMAGNPVNYGRIGRLTSAEALAASLMITHFFDEGKKMLAVFKWGQTFLTLNHDPLMDYGSANDPEAIATVEESYFGLRGSSQASHN